jgi:GNAT superfamily N-acetyltransferase
MHYQLSEVAHIDLEELAQLRVLAMQESLQAIGRFDPARARSRLLDNFDKHATRKIIVNGQLGGFFTLKEQEDHLYLDHFYIHPDFQGQGLGAAIMRALINQACARKLPLRLGALLGSKANNFYRTLGFVQIGQSQWDIYYEFPGELFGV